MNYDHVDLFTGIMKDLIQMDYNSSYQEVHDRLDKESKPFLKRCFLLTSKPHFVYVQACVQCREPYFLHMIDKIVVRLGGVYKIFLSYHQAQPFPDFYHNNFSLKHLGLSVFSKISFSTPLRFLQNILPNNVAYCCHRFLLEKNVCRIACKSVPLLTYGGHAKLCIASLRKIVNNTPDLLNDLIKIVFHKTDNSILSLFTLLELFTYNISQCVLFVKRGGDALCQEN